jgi:hypothetical protein
MPASDTVSLFKAKEDKNYKGGANRFPFISSCSEL